MRLQKKFQKQFGVRQKWDQKSQVLAPGLIQVWSEPSRRVWETD